VFRFIVLFAAFSLASAAASDRIGLLTSQTDELCAVTGMKRSGTVQLTFEGGQGRDRMWIVHVPILLDGVVTKYEIWFKANGTAVHFMPRSYRCRTAAGTGFDTLMDKNARDLCKRSVERVKKRLGWQGYGPPTTQRDGKGYRVTFLTVPPDVSSTTMLLDPYINFLVSPKGTVFGLILGP
jgi:hypothetical protein